MVLDPQRLSQPVATVEVGAHPAQVVADRQGRAYVSLSGGNEIAVVDLAAASVIERIATGAYPHGLRLSPDESELYVANVEDGSVSVIDTVSREVTNRINVGPNPIRSRCLLAPAEPTSMWPIRARRRSRTTRFL